MAVTPLYFVSFAKPWPNRPQNVPMPQGSGLVRGTQRSFGNQEFGERDAVHASTTYEQFCTEIRKSFLTRKHSGDKVKSLLQYFE
jgi:hypothetical protein